MREWLHGLIQSAMAYIEGLGEWGIMLGLMLEVIPSEIVLAFGGYLVSIKQISYAQAVIFGTIGGTVAQLFVYWIGRYGGRPFVDRFGKYLLIDNHEMAAAERWFNKYGSGFVFAGRFIPVVRHAISIPAGVARMPLARFTVLTVLAVIPWSMFFVYLGMLLKDNWKRIDEFAGPYMLPVVLGATGVLLAYLVFKLLGRKKH